MSSQHIGHRKLLVVTWFALLLAHQNRSHKGYDSKPWQKKTDVLIMLLFMLTCCLLLVLRCLLNNVMHETQQQFSNVPSTARPFEAAELESYMWETGCTSRRQKAARC